MMFLKSYKRVAGGEAGMGLQRTVLAATAVVLALAVAGCGGGKTSKKKNPQDSTALPARYSTLPPKQVPGFLEGSIFEQSDVVTVDPVLVNSWGLVVGLPGTGDSTAPMAVRDYMLREMYRRGFGQASKRDYEAMTPQTVLDDPAKRTAIVRVDALMPPGVRKGQRFDVQVGAIPESNVSSLAQGQLYRTELKVNGADARNPQSRINVMGVAEGGIFINPALALNAGTMEEGSKRSMGRRIGIIPGGGVSALDQPLVLRLRTPQYSLARRIELRVDQFFQDNTVAAAQDEGIVHLFVPESYRGDWERFMGVVMGLYFNSSPEFSSRKAAELAVEAVKPDAPLLEISFAWEGLGPVALPHITPLMLPGNRPDVQFAAARAAAYLGDAGGIEALSQIAAAESHAFQVEAVRTLGNIPSSHAVTRQLRQLLNSPSNLVRVEAYRVLAERSDPTIYTRNVDGKFLLDVVPSTGPTIVYATRSGAPRIAVIGQGAEVVRPLTFLALDDRLSLSSNEGESGITIFYRGITGGLPIRVQSRPVLADVIGWLGGAAEMNNQKLPLSYSDVVAVVQAMWSQGRVVEPAGSGSGAASAGGRTVAFMLQEAPELADVVATAPPIPERGRPQGEAEPSTQPATQESVP
jgi:hypothetical protein